MIAVELSRFKSPAEVSKYVKENLGLPVSKNAVIEFEQNNVDTINKLRVQYLADTSTIPIMHDKIRLEREELLYQLSQKLEGDTDKIDYGIKCLREAREETKVSTFSGDTNVQFNQFNILSDAELLDKKRKMESRIHELMQKGDSYA